MRPSAHGFTLIETLVVVAIIGMLAAVLIPSLLGARARAHDMEAAGCAKQIAAGQAVVYIDFQAYSTNLVTLNAATDGTASNCNDAWVNDSGDFLTGWKVKHPNGTGQVYTVGPDGIVPPP